MCTCWDWRFRPTLSQTKWQEKNCIAGSSVFRNAAVSVCLLCGRFTCIIQPLQKVLQRGLNSVWEREGGGWGCREISSIGNSLSSRSVHTPPNLPDLPLSPAPPSPPVQQMPASLWLIHLARREGSVFWLGSWTPRSSSPLASSRAGDRERKEGRWGVLNIPSNPNFTAQRCEHSERGSGSFFHHVCHHSHPADDGNQHSFQKGKRPF